MALALSRARWNEGYRWTAFVQSGILLVCIISLPLWKKKENSSGDEESGESAGIRQALKVPGVVLTLVAFYAYCAGEATCFLWVPSYFAGTTTGLGDELIASFGSLIFGGLMLGRLISGFVSDRLGDKLLIRIGIVLELLGIMILFVPGTHYVVKAAAFVIIGTGMGPVYPAIQHMAPVNFGRKNSAAAEFRPFHGAGGGADAQVGRRMPETEAGRNLLPALQHAAADGGRHGHSGAGYARRAQGTQAFSIHIREGL
jgi:fucose permease